MTSIYDTLPLPLRTGRGDCRVRRYVFPVRIVRATNGVSRDNLLLERKEIQSYVHDGMEVCTIAPGHEILLDFGCELAGGIRLVTSTNHIQLSKLILTFGESVSEALGTPNNDHAIHQTELMLPPTGMTEYGNTGFRFVRLQVPNDATFPLELIAVVAVALFRPLEYIGQFHCDDERLNQIWQTGAYTVHMNMQDYLYDGIKRDRMSWLGDIYPELCTICAVFDDTDCVEKTLNFVIEHTPKGAWINETSSYAAWWILCQHAWFWNKARLPYLQSQHKAIAAILHQLAECVDDNGKEHLPETRFLDWPSHSDAVATHVGLQGLLAWTFEKGAELAEILKDTALQTLCLSIHRRLMECPIPPVSNKSAASMLVLGGYNLDGREWIKECLEDHPDKGISTFYGYFVLQARARLGGDMRNILSLISSYWGAMLDYGATTFWEDFDLAWIKNAGRIDELPSPGQNDLHADFGNYCYRGLRHSLCHGWAGAPTAFLSEHILGVRPLEPGFRSVAIQPNFAYLKEISGAVPTPFGPITVKGTPDHWEWNVPDGIAVRQ